MLRSGRGVGWARPLLRACRETRAARTPRLNSGISRGRGRGFIIASPVIREKGRGVAPKDLRPGRERRDVAPNITSPKTTEKKGGSRFGENEREGVGPKGTSPKKGEEGRGHKGPSPVKGGEGRGSKHCFAEDKRDAP